MTIHRPIRPMGPVAALIECAPGEPGPLVLAARRVGIGTGSAGVVEMVPAACTVLVECVDAESLDRTVDLVRSIEIGRSGSDDVEVVEIPVCFDGADLDEVAARCARSADEVIGTVVAGPLTVAFCGFAPGFAYLDGLPSWLHLPRRDTPRARVPEGSFAVAAGYAAVYPSASPGGWNLLGSTSAEIWSIDRDPPAVLAPGTQVRIIAVDRT